MFDILKGAEETGEIIFGGKRGNYILNKNDKEIEIYEIAYNKELGNPKYIFNNLYHLYSRNDIRGDTIDQCDMCSTFDYVKSGSLCYRCHSIIKWHTGIDTKNTDHDYFKSLINNGELDLKMTINFLFNEDTIYFYKEEIRYIGENKGRSTGFVRKVNKVRSNIIAKFTNKDTVKFWQILLSSILMKYTVLLFDSDLIIDIKCLIVDYLMRLYIQ